MKSHAQVIVVGGGCVGASILYGLTQHGCTDAGTLAVDGRVHLACRWPACDLCALARYLHDDIGDDPHIQ